ncbi:hypothetical protein Tco_0438751 [Tanacetum coccineum]
MIIKKDLKIVKAKVVRKSLALNGKERILELKSGQLPGSEDEEYAMAVRDFKKFFKRRVKGSAFDAVIQSSYWRIPKHREQEPKSICLEVLER